MLDAADVLIDREPVLRGLAIKRRSVISRIRVAIEIPGRIDKRIHGIGFAARRAAALGTDRVDKFRHSSQRRSSGERNVDILRQDHRQIFFRHCDDAVLLAIKHRDRRAPVALPRNSPVFQAIRNRRLAEVLLFGVRRHFSNRFVAAQTAVTPGVNQRPFMRHERQRWFGDGLFRIVRDRNNDETKFQFVLPGEFVITLVMRRHAHNGAGAVVH